MQELLNAGEDVLVFYNDKSSFNTFAKIQLNNDNSMMRYSTSGIGSGGSSGSSYNQTNNNFSFSDLNDDPDEGSCMLRYHIELVRLLACCTMGKNVYTEIKCHSLLPLDDIVKMVCHPDTIPAVSTACLEINSWEHKCHGSYMPCTIVCLRCYECFWLFR